METKACATPSFLSPSTGSKFHVFTSGSTEHPKCIVYTYVELYCSNTKNFSHSTTRVDFFLASGVIAL